MSGFLEFWKTSWAEMLGEMTDVQKADRARTAYEHATALLPKRHRLFVDVRTRGVTLKAGRTAVVATVQIQRRAMFGGWRVVSTADAAEILAPEKRLEPHEVLQLGRYTGVKLTVLDFFAQTTCEGHPTEDGDVVVHVSVERDFAPSQDEMTLNCALAAQDLALEYRDGHAGTVYPPYALESH